MTRATAVRDKKCNKRMALPGLNYDECMSDLVLDVERTIKVGVTQG